MIKDIMSRKIDHFIRELVDSDMLAVKKMHKADLKIMAEELLERSYRELCNETIVEMYEERFHTFVRGAE
ncbi:MAG: hypothetical protein EB023_08405 [Flavobacteriia bacterium]|nr:hypothetical protein [Flavobacteriia bacterium]